MGAAGALTNSKDDRGLQPHTSNVEATKIKSATFSRSFLFYLLVGFYPGYLSSLTSEHFRRLVYAKNKESAVCV